MDLQTLTRCCVCFLIHLHECGDIGFMVILNKCVMLFPGPSKWHAARSHCLSLGADLITFSSKEETKAIGNVFADYSHIYIGISDEFEEGDWRWVNGQQAYFDMFDIVGLNQIDTKYEGNDRLTADWGMWSIKINKLYDVNSDREYAFICETYN